jgi:deoxyribonuclease-4
MLRLGYHVSIANGISLAFDRAKQEGCTAMQIFLTNPRGWRISYIPEEEIAAFVEKSKSFDIKPVVAHMPYLPNLASPNKSTFSKSIDSLKANIYICNKLGIKYLVAHLGSHLGEGKEKGMKNLAEAISSVEDLLGNTMILLENEAGQRNSIGSSMEDLSEIRRLVASKNVAFCLDTCHLFAAGYDLGNRKVLERIDREIGFKNVYLFHLNDAKYELGSCLDRHENIGLGCIGTKGFSEFFAYKGINSKPFIMETPEAGSGVEEIKIATALASGTPKL